MGSAAAGGATGGAALPFFFWGSAPGGAAGGAAFPFFPLVSAAGGSAGGSAGGAAFLFAGIGIPERTPRNGG